MTDTTVQPELVPKRADELVVGDLLPERHLIYKFNKGPAQVVFLADEPEDSHTFIAYRYPNGRHEGHVVRSDAVLDVYPAIPAGHDYSRAADDPEVTQPIAGRLPPHVGPVTEVGLVDESLGDCPDCRHDIAQHDGEGCCLVCHCHPNCTACEPGCGSGF